MINRITKKQYPEVFADLFEFKKKETYHEHRRNSNYYTAWLLEFTPENLPEHPEIHGLWETDTFIGDHEYGIDKLDFPDEIFRVEERKQMVEVADYVRVT